MNSDNKKEIPQLEYFEIKVEATIPCLMTFRVRAENAEEALEKFQKQSPNSFKPLFWRKKITKATVYKAGTIQVVSSKTYK